MDQKMTSEFIWTRYPDEPNKAYGAFVVYRDMGLTRTMNRVCKELGSDVNLVKRWSVTYHWKDRTSAFDEWCEIIALKAMEDEIIQMAKRHVKYARRIIEVGMARFATIKPEEAAKLDIRTSLECVKVGTTLERSGALDQARVDTYGSGGTGGEGIKIIVETIPKAEIDKHQTQVLELADTLRNGSRTNGHS